VKEEIRAANESIILGSCFGCCKSLDGDKSIKITFRDFIGNVFICLDCVRSLREQIDALRILVLTGEDTK
jgi:hypothetical protein